MRRLEIILSASAIAQIKEHLRSRVDLTPKQQAVLRYFLGDDDTRTFLGRLVLNADGSGDPVAYGLGTWVAEEDWDHVRTVKEDLPGALRNNMETKVGTAVDFYAWAATLTPALYRWEDLPEDPLP